MFIIRHSVCTNNYPIDIFTFKLCAIPVVKNRVIMIWTLYIHV